MTEFDDPHLVFSDVNDADQFDPSPLPDLGKIPDHDANDGPVDVDDVPSMSTPASDLPGRPKMPWEKLNTRAPKTSRVKRDNGAVPNLPRGFKDTLVKNYTLIGGMVMPFDMATGKAFMENADKCSEAIIDYAKTNPAFRQMLLNSMGTSAVGVLIMVHVPIMVPLFMRFGMPLFGKSPAPMDPPPVTGENIQPREPRRSWMSVVPEPPTSAV